MLAFSTRARETQHSVPHEIPLTALMMRTRCSDAQAPSKQTAIWNPLEANSAPWLRRDDGAQDLYSIRYLSNFGCCTSLHDPADGHQAGAGRLSSGMEMS